MTTGMKCPRCGMTQLPGPTCKSCGADLGGPAQSDTSPPDELAIQARPAQVEQASAQPHRLSFHGAGGTLFGIHIVNMLLTIVTLGIYYFWGKVKVRSYLFSQTEFDGDRLAYHGTGRELFIGSLKAALVFGVPIAILNVAPDLLGAPIVVKVISGVLVYFILMLLFPFAIVSARRYRLSRTSWREIRFSFRGQVWDFIKLFVGGSLLTGITFGLYYPIFETRRHAFLTSRSYFGNQRFGFDGKDGGLFGSFALALLLTLPTLGLCWFWYSAKRQRYFWEHTSLGPARFRSTVTGRRLLNLKLGNALLILVTLGLAYPWVVIREARFAFTYLTIEGPLNLAAIRQEAQAASATGEALAGFLDAGLDMGA